MLQPRFVLILGFVAFTSVSALVGDGNIAALDGSSIMFEEICKTRKCVPKCCKDGEYVFGSSKICQSKNVTLSFDFSNVPIYLKNLTNTGRFLSSYPDFFILPGKMYESEFNKSAEDHSVLKHKYYLTEEGLLYEEVQTYFDSWYIHNKSNYCIDYTLPTSNKGTPELKFWTIITKPNNTNATDNDKEQLNEGAIRHVYQEICKGRKCLSRCCTEGQHIFGFNKKCKTPIPKKVLKWNMPLDFSDVPIYFKNLTLKTGSVLANESDIFIVPGRMFDSEFNTTAFDYTALKHNYFLTEDGILFEEIPNFYDRWNEQNLLNYCVDYQLPILKINMTVPVLRFWTKILAEAPPKDDPIITAGLLISCFFLILVLIVYGILKELRNLSGMVLIAYVFSLLGAFLLLAVIQLARHPNFTCSMLSYFTYFFFLASFCWMNIMSCDIWWTFRGYAKARPIHRRGEKFKFCMYCIYAFGLPAALTAMLVALNLTDMSDLPWFVTPNIPLRGCFLADQEKLLYLYFPMLFLIICNWIFYLMTAFNIWRLHRSTAVLDSAAAGTPAAHRSQTNRFLVYLKLSLIMGINWVLEIVSSFQPHFKGWYITDIYNMLIGLSIFLIFVCKKKIFRMLKKKSLPKTPTSFVLSTPDRLDMVLKRVSFFDTEDVQTSLNESSFGLLKSWSIPHRSRAQARIRANPLQFQMKT